MAVRRIVSMAVCAFILLICNTHAVRASAIPVTRESTVSVSIGGASHYTIFGYTSPKAEVTLQGIGIFDRTTARDDGYFAFENQFSPFKAREACIIAQDQFGRLTPEVCLPPFPVTYNVNIGPVVMPPTISLDKPLYYVSDEVILTGQTIPSTKVHISSFTSHSNRLLEFMAAVDRSAAITYPVEAYMIPQVEAEADDKGNFSISLPSSSVNQYRIFTQTALDNEASPKSLTLSFTIYPIWYIFIQYLTLLIQLLNKYLVEVLITLNILVLLILTLRKYLTAHGVIHRYAIMIRNKNLLALKPTRYEITPYTPPDTALLK